jgi:hypothetical protein
VLAASRTASARDPAEVLDRLIALIAEVDDPSVAAIGIGVPGRVDFARQTVLSAGVDHETFITQVEIAMGNGAAGVIAGRALWKDCISRDRAVTRARLESVAVPRLREILEVFARHRPRVAA